MTSIRTQLTEIVSNVVTDLGYDAQYGEVVLSNRPDLSQFQCNGALAAAGAQLVTLPAGAGGVDLGALLDELGRRQCNEVLVEAGPRLAGAFLAAGLADELIVYIAPHPLGHDARPVFELPPVLRMHARLDLEPLDVLSFGPDLRLRLRPTARA